MIAVTSCLQKGQYFLNMNFWTGQAGLALTHTLKYPLLFTPLPPQKHV